MKFVLERQGYMLFVLERSFPMNIMFRCLSDMLYVRYQY